MAVSVENRPAQIDILEALAAKKEGDLLTKEEEQFLGRIIEEGRLAFRRLAILRQKGLIDFEEFPQLRGYFSDSPEFDGLISKTPFPSERPKRQEKNLAEKLLYLAQIQKEITDWKNSFFSLPRSKMELQVTVISLEESLERAQKAREIFLDFNIGLVKSRAQKRFSWLEDKESFPLDDLINEGVFGLIEGVERYDYRMNLKFSTYTIYWINQTIDRAIKERGLIIRLPIHVHEALGRIRRATGELALELGRQPNPEEIAAEVGLTPGKVIGYLSAAWSPVSLETKVGEDEDTELKDFFPSEEPSTEEIATQNLRRQEILRKLESLVKKGILTERELAVLRRRCGFEDGTSQTLEQTGKQLESQTITRERVRQIEGKALRKIAPHLREFRDSLV